MTAQPTDLNQFMNEHKRLIEDYLVRLLPHQATHSLFAAMQYSVLNNGKRLRPIMIYAVGQALGCPIERLHGAAAALELIHCYSLVHDDLPAMDDDALRRGMPTCHKAFGEATAILTGDALLTMAFEVLSDSELNPVPPAQQIAMVSCLSKAAGGNGMILGQEHDMEAENRLLHLEDLAHMHRLKTGALFDACIELSLIASGDDNNASIREALLDYSHNVGLAFQIQDDILDVVGDEQLIGKTVGADLAAGKSTFTSLLGLEGAQRHAAKALQQAIDALQPLGDSAALLAELARYIVDRNK